MSELHNLVFFGKIIPGQEPAQVRERITALFKLSPRQCERVFSGQRVILKGRLPSAEVKPYVAYLEQLGVRVTVEPPLKENQQDGDGFTSAHELMQSGTANPFVNTAWSSIILPGYVQSQGSVSFWVQVSDK